MKRLKWHFLFGFSLVVLSVLLYFAHYVIFRDPHHIFIYFVGDVAFLPIEVLLVTLILHRLLTEREKRALLKKLNMVIGAFFSEVGTNLLKDLTVFASQPFTTKLDNRFFQQDLFKTNMKLEDYEPGFDCLKGELESLRCYLINRREFLLRLLENPVLLEHESFTELLWALFHLTEELALRTNVKQLSKADYRHLADDMKRAYLLLITEWLKYMKHLKGDYPYLFSLALRTNPFDPYAAPEIK